MLLHALVYFWISFFVIVSSLLSQIRKGLNVNEESTFLTALISYGVSCASGKRLRLPATSSTYPFSCALFMLSLINCLTLGKDLKNWSIIFCASSRDFPICSPTDAAPRPYSIVIFLYFYKHWLFHSLTANKREHFRWQQSPSYSISG